MTEIKGGEIVYGGGALGADGDVEGFEACVQGGDDEGEGGGVTECQSTAVVVTQNINEGEISFADFAIREDVWEWDGEGHF